MNFASSTDDLITKLFDRAKELNANQITFRKLYTSGLNTKQDEWIINNDIDNKFWTKINSFIKSTGRELEMLYQFHKQITEFYKIEKLSHSMN